MPVEESFGFFSSLLFHSETAGSLCVGAGVYAMVLNELYEFLNNAIIERRMGNFFKFVHFGQLPG
jgi:hypothetical protein